MDRAKPLDRARLDPRAEVVRLPRVDWNAIRAGAKTEVRISGRGTPNWILSLAAEDELPRPILAWSMQRYRGEASTAMLWLDEAWSEPLGSISDESLAREGFDGERKDALKAFRHYWRNRHQSTGFRPLSTVQVLRIRPLKPLDYPEAGLALLRRFYGEFIET